MKAAHRLLLPALASLMAGGVGLAQSSPAGGPAAFAPRVGVPRGPFSVCSDPNGSGNCVVETGVRIRAGGRVDVHARGRVNFGGGVSSGTASAVASALVGMPVPLGRVGDAVTDPDGEAASDPASPAPALRKNSLVILVAGAGTGFQTKGVKAGKFYQGGKAASITPAEDGEIVLMVNDAQPADNRAVCEAGICGWEVTLDVYDPPAAGPVATQQPASGASSPGGSDAPASRTPVSGSQPPQVATLVTNPGGGSQPPQGPPLDSPLGRAGTVVTVPGSGLPPHPSPVAGGSHPDDAEGSSDHPLVPRARGAVVRSYDMKRLDAYQLPLGPAAGSGFTRSEKIRGQVTHLFYDLAPDCSVLEAGEQYASALRQRGFEMVFACEDADCGPDYGLNDGIRHRYWSPGYGQRQFTAVLRRGSGNVYASVHVQGMSPTGGAAWVTVVESAPGASVPAGSTSGPTSPSIPPSGGSRQPKEGEGGTGPPDRPAISGSGVGQAPVSGIGAGAGQATGSPAASGVGAAASPAAGSSPAASQAPASGIVAAASGNSPAPSQAPVSGIGSAASTGPASGTGQQPPAAGVGAAGQGAQSPASGIGSVAQQGSTPPASLQANTPK